MWSRLRRAIGALEGAGVHKERDPVLKPDNGSASPAKDRAHAQEFRLRQRSERAVLRLRGNPRTEGVDRHLPLFRRPAYADRSEEHTSELQSRQYLAGRHL